MRHIKLIALILFSVASAMGQITVQQPTGIYTNNSLVLRDGTSNKVKNTENITYDYPNSTLKMLQLNGSYGGTGTSFVMGRTAETFKINASDGSTTIRTLTSGTLSNIRLAPNAAQVIEVSYDNVSGIRSTTITGPVDADGAILSGGSVSGARLTSTISTGTSPLVVTSTTLVPNLYVARAALADTSTTNANLTGDVTSSGNATTLTNAPVIAKVLTGYTSGAGTVAAADSILQAIQKLNGNDATNANLTGPITSSGNATSIASQTGTGTTFAMSAGPSFTTSVNTASTSFTAFAGATTLLTFGGTGASASTFMPSTLDATSSTSGAIRSSGGISAAKAANFGTTLNVGTQSGLGIASSASTALNLAIGTTTIASLRMGHGAAPTSPVNGDMWSTTSGFYGRVNGVTVGPLSAGVGTVTVVAAGSLTSTALVTGGGTTTLQTPSATATMDGSGNISTPGSLSIGVGGTTAGAMVMTQGTTQATGTTNITVQAPASVTSYLRTLEGSAGSTGFYLGTVSGTTVTDSKVASIGTGSVVLSAGTLNVTSAKTLAVTNSITLSGTDSTTMTFPSTSATLARTDAVNTFTGLQTFSTGIVSTAGTNSIGSLVDSVDGVTPLMNTIVAYGAGTDYSLTATSAAIDFGTTDPTITLINAGTYLVSGTVNLRYNGATFAANRTITLKLRRTNNTAADLTNGTSFFTSGIVTTTTAGFLHVKLNPVIYTTTNTNDAITVFADVSVVPSAGSFDATSTGSLIIAERKY